MTNWNFADVWEIVADELAGSPCQIQGARSLSWGDFDRRADGVARWLLDLGVSRGEKVAQYLYNAPEYLESLFATFKVGLVPVNTNYRYADEELLYLWNNADAVAVVFHGTFTERIEGLRASLPGVRGWLWVDDATGPCPPWAAAYEDAAATAPGRACAPWGRSGDDLYLLYTGGTTGAPKGVMWRQDDLFATLNASSLGVRFGGGGLEQVRSSMTAPGPRMIPACPLMHGTGSFTAFGALASAGCVVTLTKRNFDPEELLDAIGEHGVNLVAIVGDAFAKPLLRVLDANAGRWDLSSLVAIVSSGVMWSEETKQGLLRHHPGMILADQFSSSEALGMGSSVSSARGTTDTAKFRLGDNARVIAEDGHDVVAGSGEVGMVAVRGRTPVGYYKDPEKSAKTFRTIEGFRYSVPGDLATVDADGRLRLLGRGSQCINTGGEKVYPEEVEEVLKTHPDVRDAVAVGVPDDKWGEAICALVETVPGRSIDDDAIVTYVKSRLASFKAPKHVLTIDTIGRAPNGKVDYKRLKAEAIELLCAPPGSGATPTTRGEPGAGDVRT